MNNETNLNGLIKRMIQFIVPNQINANTVGDTDTHINLFKQAYKFFKRNINNSYSILFVLLALYIDDSLTFFLHYLVVYFRA